MSHRSVVAQALWACRCHSSAQKCRVCGAYSGLRTICGNCAWLERARERPKIDAQLRALRRRKRKSQR